jgi:polyhydroxyalkanoate synthesis regulator phasin
MRSCIAIVSTIVVLSALGFAGKEESLGQLIERAQSARVADQPGLYIVIAQRELKAADQAYVAGKPDEGKAAVSDLLTYAEKAHDTAKNTGKKQKNIEISLRKMAAKLRDIKRTQSADEQDILQKAADRLEDLRTDLLTHMFAKGSK